MKWRAAKGESKRSEILFLFFFFVVVVPKSPTVTRLSFPAVQFKIAKPHPLVSVLLPYINQVIIPIAVNSYLKVEYIAVSERMNQAKRCIFF